VRGIATLALLAALLGGGTLLVGQEQEADDHDSIRPIGGLAFVDELEVTVVNIVAYVTDKEGAAVTNLTRDDFRIFHDGEERPISNFQLYTEELIRSYYQAEEGPPLPPAAEPETELEAPPLTEIQPVWVMILVDNDNLQPLDRNRVLGQLRTFVRENTKPPVKMMVASTNRALKIEQEFTDDSTEILGALEGVKMTTGGRTSRDSARTEVYDEIDRFTQSQSSSGSSSLNQARGLAVSFAEEELNGLQFTFGVIREAINLLAGLPGKKMIVHLSNGLPMTPGSTSSTPCRTRTTSPEWSPRECATRRTGSTTRWSRTPTPRASPSTRSAPAASRTSPWARRSTTRRATPWPRRWSTTTTSTRCASSPRRRAGSRSSTPTTSVPGWTASSRISTATIRSATTCR
jgi:VWFA-related protein